MSVLPTEPQKVKRKYRDLHIVHFTGGRSHHCVDRSAMQCAIFPVTCTSISKVKVTTVGLCRTCVFHKRKKKVCQDKTIVQ